LAVGFPLVVYLITREAPGGPEQVVRQYLHAVGSGECEDYMPFLARSDDGNLVEADRHAGASERYTIADCETGAGPFLDSRVEDVDIERTIGAGRKDRERTTVSLYATVDGERRNWTVELRLEDGEWKLYSLVG
jgi:hypothetical protein